MDKKDFKERVWKRRFAAAAPGAEVEKPKERLAISGDVQDIR
jgi:hypothetical protein